MDWRKSSIAVVLPEPIAPRIMKCFGASVMGVFRIAQ
jgi:hypothetical protein